MFTVTVRDLDTGELITTEHAAEHAAVGTWEAAKHYANLEPVSIEPEPDWSRYTYGGRTPLTR